MNNLKFATSSIESSREYLKTLNKNDYKNFYPANSGLTKDGKSLRLGLSTYGLKLYFMLGEWQQLSESNKKEWIDFINSFKKNYKNFPTNSFIDDTLYNHYTKLSILNSSKDIIKSTINKFTNQNYDTNKTKFQKAVNADTKQAIATLFEVGYISPDPFMPKFNSPKRIEEYLNSLNWETPWTSGAQFASYCVYSKINSNIYHEILNNFINKIVSKETGSYYSNTPSHSREIINGAMKVLTGLDWIDSKIHYPEKLIDYCISNKPVMEGCDIVDYIYVLYRCCKETEYKKEEIVKIFDESIDDIKSLFHEKDGGFSYFKNKSQTHYYGINITQGNDTADIHGTLLCVWALMMILDTTNNLDTKFNLIKP
ncbi:hypothetical protein OA408_00515 [Acidimicrobiaceae bacterium]|nr:hypothetical protein [Acidimicrobiaceae bacterium]